MGDSLPVVFEASNTTGDLAVPRCARKSKASRVTLPTLPLQMLSHIGISVVAVVVV